jgi:hypothetical protein
VRDYIVTVNDCEGDGFVHVLVSSGQALSPGYAEWGAESIPIVEYSASRIGECVGRIVACAENAVARAKAVANAA